MCPNSVLARTARLVRMHLTALRSPVLLCSIFSALHAAALPASAHARHHPRHPHRPRYQPLSLHSALSSASHHHRHHPRMAASGEEWGVIWMHGLGDEGASWESIEHELKGQLPFRTRWMFPDAPMQPVAVNNGHVMPSWFDISDIPLTEAAADFPEDYAKAVTRVNTFIDDFVAKGIPTERIFIGGFSQGGALSIASVYRSERKLAGAICLSGWVFESTKFVTHLKAANKGTPIFWGHGTLDTVVDYPLQASGVALLKENDIKVTARSYRMAHSALPEELGDVADFIAGTMAEQRK